ncbi:hypothetical protein C2845_PM04G30380 [Panicum miliaceum]|uniref:Legume lectin domain-containing protein n=1 Tax=Panicum miliaceum TaxID=4540 RepID=A0A3L6QTB5_PANMI|nr:hypothetical protein C2845_PM04G30380 [Panicum miliaceum]
MAKADQYLGLPNIVGNGSESDRILAVELDTIMNPELRDIDSNHVGVDVNSLVSRQASPAGYYDDDVGGTFQELRLNSREPMQLWVDYDGQARQLDVTLAPVRVPKPKRPLLSMNIDLSTVIADPVYIGFSSATGITLTNHYVLGWSFSLDGPASSLDFSKLPVLPLVGPKPRSKVFVVVLPLAIASLVAAVLAAIFLIVLTRRRRAVLSTALPGQFLGLLNNTNDGNRSAHVFAVEFDTLFNADFHDLNSNHVGVDVDSLESRVAADAGYYDDATGLFRNLSLISRKAMQVWVDYDGAATQVTVTMAPIGLARPKKPLLQTTVDLSDVVQDAAYVGFTSATGILFSRHFVLGWSFGLDGPAPALNISALPALPPAGPKPRSKVLVIVLPIASATLVFAVGIAIYALVQRRINARPTIRQVMQYLDGDMVLPDLSPEHFGFTVMEQMYSREFDKNMTMSCVSSTSMGTVSDISGGR